MTEEEGRRRLADHPFCSACGRETLEDLCICIECNSILCYFPVVPTCPGCICRINYRSHTANAKRSEGTRRIPRHGVPRPARL
jgi:hypothetical protein